MKRKNKYMIASALLALSCIGAGVGTTIAQPKVTASALTYETMKFEPQGTTTYGSTTIRGCPSNFQIYMYGTYMNDETGWMYEDDILNWYRYSVDVEVKSVTNHISFAIYKDDELYSKKDLSGNDSTKLCSEVLEDGIYTIEYKCRYRKNIFQSYTNFTFKYRFEVDKSAPNYTLKSNGKVIESGGSTKQDIEYHAIDPNLCRIEYQKPGSSKYYYEYGAYHEVEATEANNGLWTFRAMDWVGNVTSTVKVYLDTLAPIGTVTNQDDETIANGGATNKPFIYSTTDSNTVQSIEYKSPNVTTWKTYPKNVSILTSNGWYNFRTIDGAGNVSDEYRVYYDNVLPTGCVYDANTAKGSGAVTNKSYIKYVASDSGSGIAQIYVQKPGANTFVNYANNSQLTGEGKYRFKAYDAAGNVTTTTHEITLDMTAPIGKLKTGGVVVESGSYTSKTFSYTATDEVGIEKYQYKTPDSTDWLDYTAGKSVSGTEGWYYFRAIDTAGNVSEESKIFYDGSAPYIQISKKLGSNVLQAENGEHVSAAAIWATAKDENSEIESIIVWGTNYSGETSYINGAQLTKEGWYYFETKNKAGVSSEICYVLLDRTPATPYLYAGDSFPTSVSVTNAPWVCYEAFDIFSEEVMCFVKMPGSNEFVEYEANTKLTETGEYQFYSLDKAGNQSAISSITIDREIPFVVLYADGEVVANNSYTNAQKIKFESDATCYVKRPGESEFKPYVSGTEMSGIGRYEFYAENELGIATDIYVLVIDRTPKQVIIQNVSGRTDCTSIGLSWVDGDLLVTAPISKITINGVNYPFGSVVQTLAKAVYNVVVYDAAGNTWETSFRGGELDLSVMTTQKTYWEVKDDWNDRVYGFRDYNNAWNYAYNTENGFVEVKTWNTATWDQGLPMDTKDSINAQNGNYYVYKSEEDSKKEVAYFTQERLKEVVEKYAEQRIQTWYYWEKEPIKCLDGLLNAYPNEKKIVAAELNLREGLIYTLDGVKFNGLTITTPGWHTLLIEDGYKHSVEYTICILDAAPTLQYALGDNTFTEAGFDRTYYFNDKVTLSIPMEDDEFAMFVVYDKNGNRLGCYDIDNRCVIENSGVYTARTVNHYGYSEEFSFVVSINTPMVTVTENTKKKTLDMAVTKSTDKESHITFIEIAKTIDGGETWIALTEDDYGKAITVNTLEYHFRTSGVYKITVMDEFRTGIDAITQTIEYKQPTPDGVLVGVEDGGYTNKSVTFTWTDEAEVKLTKDGVAIEYRSGKRLSEDGVYVLKFSNFDGYSKTYKFVIDTLVPVITLDGAEDGESVTTSVKAYFGDDETAEIFKDGVSLGVYKNGDIIEENGVYRIVVRDKALNETAVTFTIDATLDWSININEKGLANSVIITAEETVEIVLMKNGRVVDYTLGNTISKIGDYSLIITDILGNTESRNFTIVAPIAREFSHNFNDMPGFEKLLVNDIEKTLEDGMLTLTKDGEYEVCVVANGERYSFRITVDSMLPEILLDGVKNGGATNDKVSIMVAETADVEVYFNDEFIDYTLGEWLIDEGEYRVVATDKAGNSLEVTFTIDKTAPVLTLNGVEDGGATRDSVVIWAGKDAILKVYFNDVEMEYNLEDELTAEGVYKVTATDSVGNVREATFRIDKTAPEIMLNGVENGKKTNKNVIITVADDAVEYKVYLNDEELAYKLGNEVKGEGVYKVTVTDVLGNATEVTFTVDKTAPKITLNGVKNGGKTTGEVSLSNLTEDAKIIATKNGKTIAYTIGEKLNGVGRYEFNVVDDAGNVSEYSFEIIKPMSVWAIAGIALGCFTVLGAASLVILKRRGVI